MKTNRFARKGYNSSFTDIKSRVIFKAPVLHRINVGLENLIIIIIIIIIIINYNLYIMYITFIVILFLCLAAFVWLLLITRLNEENLN
jgi:hypothetical protein